MFSGIHNQTQLKVILLWAALGIEGVVAVFEIALVYRLIL